MTADDRNKHVRTNHTVKLQTLYIVLIAIQILTSKHPKLFCIYFLKSNGMMRKNRVFISPKCRK